MTTVNTPKRFSTLLLAGVIASAGFGVAAPVFTASEAPVAAAEQNGEKQIVVLNQFGYDHATADVDCGPTAAVVSMLAAGYTPDNWDPNNGGPAIQTVRDAIGHQDGTFGYQVADAIAAQGVPAESLSDWDVAVEKAKNGDVVIVNGYMDALPFVYDYRSAQGVNPHVNHWISAVDYNAETGEFTIVDSNTGITYELTERQLELFQASLPAAQQAQVVVG